MNEQPIGKVDVKKELLIAAWFWIAALITGILLMKVVGLMLEPDQVVYRVIGTRMSYSAGLRDTVKTIEEFDKAGRQFASICLIFGMLLTSVAWMFHSRRFSLKVYMTAVLIVGGSGAVPHLRFGFQHPPEAHVEFELSPGLTSGQMESLSRELRPSEAFKKLPLEQQKRLEPYANRIQRSWGMTNNVVVDHIEIQIFPEQVNALEDIKFLAGFYAQYIDLLLLDILDPTGKDERYRPAGNFTSNEWSRRYATSFEAEYRARKKGAKGLAEKKEKPEGP